MPTYTPPLRDMQFVMHEVFNVTADLQQIPKHADIDADTINAVLEEGGKFAAEVAFPLNISGDAEQDYFADGVVEEIITALSRFRHLFVIARNSSFFYKGTSPDIRQVGRELGVRYLLEGSVRKAGSRPLRSGIECRLARKGSNQGA